MDIIKSSAELIAMSFPVEEKDGNFIPVKTEHNIESIIEEAGRTCYATNDKITEDSCIGFVDRVVNMRHHESIAEHASLTIRIVCPRDVLAQITRHRLASFSVQSQRYVNYGKKGLKFVLPTWLYGKEDTKVYDKWVKSKENVEFEYNDFLAEGWMPEQARVVLPNDTATEIVMTANVREWMLVLNLRTKASAYSEIRIIADQIKDILNKVSPTLFKKD